LEIPLDILKIEQISEQLLPMCQECMDGWKGSTLDTSYQINALQFLGLTPLKITQEECDKEALKISKALAYAWLELLSLYTKGKISIFLMPTLFPAEQWRDADLQKELIQAFKSVLSGLMISFQEACDILKEFGESFKEIKIEYLDDLYTIRQTNNVNNFLLLIKEKMG
jgi:hypothetical protein